MGIKLEKLVLLSPAEINALPPQEARRLLIDYRDRMEIYQSLLYKERRRRFGSKSERSVKSKEQETNASSPSGTMPEIKPRADTTKLLSERYPDATVQVEDIYCDQEQPCPACGGHLQDSGMTEDSEYLTVIPKEYRIVRQRRHKYRCKTCHGAIVTASLPARVIPGGSYSDDLIIDVTQSKYCNLIPMERYSKMAEYSGFAGLPPHSLIQASFKLAEYLTQVYQAIKEEALRAEVLSADETPHRMLEGDEKKRWFLWLFNSKLACFFECHNTRSGDVSTEILKQSVCLYLLTDVYSGYKKSTREANQIRIEKKEELIKMAYCNAHARRNFENTVKDEQGKLCADAQFMMDQYRKIYGIEANAKKLSGTASPEARGQMKPVFEAMQAEASMKIHEYSSNSELGKAYSYFLRNYEGLTIFLTNENIPIDNNRAERLLRSPVIGRKIWYGTHSKRGAMAAAVHFTIIETCKMNGVNPSIFYKDCIERIREKQEILTPSQYMALIPKSD